MTTIKDLERQLYDITVQLDKIKAEQAVKAQPTEPLTDDRGRVLLVPKGWEGEYWTITSPDIVCSEDFTDHSYDLDCIKQGSAFVEKAAAEQEKVFQQAMQKLRVASAETGFVPDWSDSKQHKYFGCYEYELDQWVASYSWVALTPATVPFPDKQSCLYAHKSLTEDEQKALRGELWSKGND